MGKYGKKKEASGFGFRAGKNGAKMIHALNQLKPDGDRPSITRKNDQHRTNPKKVKRRALRAVVVPAELKTGKRANKKLLLQVHMMGAEAAQAAAAEVRAGVPGATGAMDTA